MKLLKKMMIVVAILFLFSPSGKKLYSVDAEKNKPVLLKEALADFKELSEKNDPKLFKKRITSTAYLQDIVNDENKIEDEWTKEPLGLMRVLGGHIGLIIKNNYQNTSSTHDLYYFLYRLSGLFQENTFVTVSWNLYNHIVYKLTENPKGGENNPNYSSFLKRLKFSKLNEENKNESFFELEKLGQRVFWDSQDYKRNQDLKELNKKKEILENSVEELNKYNKNLKKQMWRMKIGFLLIIFLTTCFLIYFFKVRKGLKVKIPRELEKISENQDIPISQKLNKGKGNEGQKISIQDAFTKYFEKITEIEKTQRDVQQWKEEKGLKIDTKADVEKFEELKEGFNQRLNELESRFKGLLYDEFVKLQKEIIGFRNLRSEEFSKNKTVSKGGSSVGSSYSRADILKAQGEMEYKILKSIWQKESQNARKKQLFTLLEKLKDNDYIFKDLRELLAMVQFSEELYSNCENTLQPALDYKRTLDEIKSVKNIIKKKEFFNFSVDDILEIREKIYFLASFQSSQEVSNLIDFNLEDWFYSDFLSFADDFLLQYQKMELTGSLTEQWKTISPYVEAILLSFDVEAIAIILETTQFDPKFHENEGCSHKPSLPTETILAVQGNGFKRKNGDVFRYSKVIISKA